MSDFKIIYNQSKFVSAILAFFLLLIFFGGKMFFFNVGISIRPYYIILFPLLIFGIFGRYNRSEFFKINSLFAMMLLILLLGFIALFTSSLNFDSADTFKFVLFFVIQTFCFLILSMAFLQCDVNFLYRRIIKLAPFITLPPLFIFVYNALTYFGSTNKMVPGVFFGLDGLPRMTGLFDDPNYFSLYTLAYLYICLIILSTDKIKLSLLVFVSLFVGLLNVVFSFSRTAIVVLVFFIMLNLLSNKSFRKNLPIVVLIIILLTVLVLSLNETILDLLLAKFFNPTEDGGSTEERGTLLFTGLQSGFLYPIGVGIGNTTAYFMKYYGQPKLAHNDWITVLIECGILGVIIYIGMWLKVFFSTRVRLVKIAIICAMLHLSTLSLYYYEPIVPFFLIFLYFNTVIIENRSKCISSEKNSSS